MSYTMFSTPLEMKKKKKQTQCALWLTLAAGSVRSILPGTLNEPITRRVAETLLPTLIHRGRDFLELGPTPLLYPVSRQTSIRNDIDQLSAAETAQIGPRVETASAICPTRH